MASAGVSGAHLTGTTETSRPTVFEILSQDGFANALKPAAAHVVKVGVCIDYPYEPIKRPTDTNFAYLNRVTHNVLGAS